MARRRSTIQQRKDSTQNLRHLISHSETAQGYLDLFDECVREYEFAVALEMLCDFLVEADSPVEPAVLVQIDDLHKLMNVQDTCVEKLWELNDTKQY